MRLPNLKNDTAVKIAKSCGFKTSRYLCLISKLKQPQVPVTILPGRIVCSAIYSHGSPVFTLYSKHDNPLQWRLNERGGVSNHRCLHCLLNCWFKRRSNKTSKLCITVFCVGNSPVTGEFPAQRPVKRKMFPFDDVIMQTRLLVQHVSSPTGSTKSLFLSVVLRKCHSRQLQIATMPIGAQLAYTKNPMSQIK